MPNETVRYRIGNVTYNLWNNWYEIIHYSYKAKINNLLIGRIKPMRGYICFYGSKRIEVRAQTTFEAQKIAALELHVPLKKRYSITVVLAEDEQGKPVVHTPVD